MSEFDPTAASRAIDSALTKVVSGLPQPGSPRMSSLDILVSRGAMNSSEAGVIRDVVAKGQAPNGPPPAAVVKAIDDLRDDPRIEGPVALTILRVIRFAADRQAVAETDPQHQSLVSVPNIDWESAAEDAATGAVAGGGGGMALGGVVGVALGPEGGAAGVVVGGVVGAVVGAVSGWIHGATGGSGGAGGHK
jgi:hypothetical protein